MKKCPRVRIKTKPLQLSLEFEFTSALPLCCDHLFPVPSYIVCFAWVWVYVCGKCECKLQALGRMWWILHSQRLWECPWVIRELMVVDSARWKQSGNAETTLRPYLWTAGEQVCFYFLELCWAVNKILYVCFLGTCILFFLFDDILVDSSFWWIAI